MPDLLGQDMRPGDDGGSIVKRSGYEQKDVLTAFLVLSGRWRLDQQRLYLDDALECVARIGSGPIPSHRKSS